MAPDRAAVLAAYCADVTFWLYGPLARRRPWGASLPSGCGKGGLIGRRDTARPTGHLLALRRRWRVTDNPTKTEELAHWRHFRSTLPPCSYLDLYLRGSDTMLEHYMAQDLSCEFIQAIRRGRDEALRDASEANKARDAARQERDKMQAGVDQLRRDAARCREELRELAQAVQTLAIAAQNSLQRAVNVVARAS